MDCTGRVRFGLSWNLNNGTMVLGPAEPVQHNDRISLSAGALLKSKDVYPACGDHLIGNYIPRAPAMFVRLPALPTSSRALTTSKTPRIAQD